MNKVQCNSVQPLRAGFILADTVEVAESAGAVIDLRKAVGRAGLVPPGIEIDEHG